jgi:hypothetical protein
VALPRSLLLPGWRDISVRYKQTVIGIAWAFIRPFITMVVFTVVFGRIANLPTPGSVPYLAGGEARLDRLAALLESRPEAGRAHVSRRAAMLRSWSRNGRRVLPLVWRVLGNGGDDA